MAATCCVDLITIIHSEIELVDRITPRSTTDMWANIEAALGSQDATLFTAEAFVQPVLQDNFAGPVPNLAEVGVTVAPYVDPYEEAKKRILNGGHTCVTYMAALEGVATFDAAMDQPDLFDHFWRYETQEVLPGLTIDLPFNKAEYLNRISARFKDGAIAGYHRTDLRRRHGKIPNLHSPHA